MSKIKSYDATSIVRGSSAPAQAWKSAASHAKRASTMLKRIIADGQRLGLDIASLDALRGAASIAHQVAELYRDAARLRGLDEARFQQYEQGIVSRFRAIWDAMTLADRIALIAMLDSTQLYARLEPNDLQRYFTTCRSALGYEIYRSWKENPLPSPEMVVARLHRNFLAERSALLQRHAGDIAKIADRLSHRWGAGE